VRNTHYFKGRLLIVVACALPAYAVTSGCKTTASSGQNTVDDAALAARVKQALAADPVLKSLPVSVATYRGVVQLSGYVDSDAQIQTAFAVARGVQGVQSVSNDLQLRSR
jgi:hyperosmotically inducible periplasmic protein